MRVNVQIHIQMPVLDKYFNSKDKEFFFFAKIEHDQPVERIFLWLCAQTIDCDFL